MNKKFFDWQGGTLEPGTSRITKLVPTCPVACVTGVQRGGKDGEVKLSAKCEERERRHRRA